MSGEAILRKSCEKFGIDFDANFFYKESRVALHSGKEIKQQFISSAITEKNYITRYYPDNDIFVAWVHLRGRNSCSFNVPVDYKIQPGTIRDDWKRIGHTSEKEPIYSFYSCDVDKFIEMIANGDMVVG